MQGMGCMDLWAVTPEMTVAGMALFLVPVAGWARGRWRKVPSVLAFAGIVAALAFTANLTGRAPSAAFCDTFAVDGLAIAAKLVILSGALIALPLLMGYFRDRPQEAHAPLALLFTTVGGMGLVSALDLGLIVLFIQMVSLPAYVLVAQVHDSRPALEATIKYFIYAAVALAIMAYGLTFLFGLTGSLELRAIGQALQGSGETVWITVALGLVVLGYGFEATLVPFHFWAPDVYEGSNAPAAGFVSVMPKVAALAALARFLVEALPQGTGGWHWLIAALAVLSMTWGNVAALRQEGLKRLLAYSSIAQAGYVLVGVAVLERSPQAPAAVLYYLAAYLFMNLVAFGVVAQVERWSGGHALDDVAGLGRTAPLPAAALVIALLSLAGLPPLAGFFGKVLLITVAIDGGMAWLAVVAVVNMAVGLYYYARVIARMYFAALTEGVGAAPGTGYAIALTAGTAGTLVLGIVPALPLNVAALAADIL